MLLLLLLPQMPHVAHVLSACNMQHQPYGAQHRGTWSCANRRAAFIELRLSTTVCSWQLSHPVEALKVTRTLQTGIRMEMEMEMGMVMGVEVRKGSSDIHTWIVCCWVRFSKCNIVAPPRGEGHKTGNLVALHLVSVMRDFYRIHSLDGAEQYLRHLAFAYYSESHVKVAST